MKRKIFFILRFLLSGAIIFALFKVVPYEDVISVYRRASKFYLLLGFLFIFLGNIIASLRWRFVINSLGASLSIREAFYAFFSSTAFNLIFPSLLAGDIFRGFALSTRFKNQTKKVISSLIIDRTSGAVSLALLVIFSYLIGRSLIKEPEILVGVILIATLGVVIILAIFNNFIFSLVKKIFTGRKKAEERIHEFEREFHFLRKRPSIFWKTVICFSLPIQIVTVFSFFFVCKSFYIDLDLIYFFIFVPIIMLVAFLPITVAGIGTREAATIYFFSKVGLSRPVSLGMSVMNLVFLIGISLIGGIIYVMVYHRWLESYK
ncbi:MAG: hypothetical protein DRP68_02485 [Candidatus Omnitrophota bacterium]|nr:MAG: hypothetical protein DRP68_02485 [Candidatus Omnitrophota bacterium]HDN86051.1 flippase-like domain-containing protein [Candidatus Omnitrophota bacterium]